MMYLLHLLFLALFVLYPTQAVPIIKDNSKLIRTFLEVSKGLDGFQVSNCSLAQAHLPLHDTHQQLPPPAQGLHLKYVVVGRGTQNYTCHSDHESAVPDATGAAATLFDASCIAPSVPEILHALPSVVMDIPSTTIDFVALLVNRVASASESGLFAGEHYFDAAGVPFFDFRLGGHRSWMAANKTASVPAPNKRDVAWLKLDTVEGQGIKEVYRVHTAGGQPPATCKGQHKKFEVEYAAEYWFYG
ncbi:hypothetical protein FE257_003118 [Aspergillus nanangensis]|uniref:Malate dehydrogenase n=1 Tax=Aspergillus nanangensis TaxID=2582783 RepID=A0AAD4CBX4_ASPNN|nr:hypothetical protein FE257_003118 [Aspergillus nanangensis]